MKILLLGKNGQVGWELQRSLMPLGDVIAPDRQFGQLCGDLSNPQGIINSIREIKPDIIVNAAAYTAVDKAESEPERAKSINTEALFVLAQEAKRLNAWLVHYSTDYVFDGSGSNPWEETDITNPLNVYGKTKLEGEKIIQNAGCNHLIFRTSWVYAARGHNFIKIILNLCQTKKQLSIVHDQYGAPTGAELIADVTTATLKTVSERTDLGGLYHLVATGETSWYDYAAFLVERMKHVEKNYCGQLEELLPIPSTDF